MKNNKNKVISKGIVGITNKVGKDQYVLFVDIDNNYDKDELLIIMKKYKLLGVVIQSNNVKFEHEDSYLFTNQTKKYHIVCFNIMNYNKVKLILKELYDNNLCDKHFYEAFIQLKKNTLRIMPKHDHLKFKLMSTFDHTDLTNFTYVHTNLIHLYECLLNKLITSAFLINKYKTYEYHEIKFSMYDFKLK